MVRGVDEHRGPALVVARLKGVRRDSIVQRARADAFERRRRHRHAKAKAHCTSCDRERGRHAAREDEVSRMPLTRGEEQCESPQHRDERDGAKRTEVARARYSPTDAERSEHVESAGAGVLDAHDAAQTGEVLARGARARRLDAILVERATEAGRALIVQVTVRAVHTERLARVPTVGVAVVVAELARRMPTAVRAFGAREVRTSVGRSFTARAGVGDKRRALALDRAGVGLAGVDTRELAVRGLSAFNRIDAVTADGERSSDRRVAVVGDGVVLRRRNRRARDS